MQEQHILVTLDFKAISLTFNLEQLETDFKTQQLGVTPVHGRITL
jgi:hypothetical protein